VSERALASEDGNNEYLLAGLVDRARERGLRLAPHEVYDFMTPPILGGEVDEINLRPASFVVALDIGGQIHEQIKDLPEGTPVTLDVEPPE
jgi:Domain of unknown function (DUF1851)